MEEDREVTPEEYRVEVLKRRFANKVADYEDEIAGLITQMTYMQQQLEQQQEGQDDVVPEKEAPEAE